MNKLMKPAEYAQELGISRQAVYAKIKKGILKSKNVEGKLYIVVENTKDNQEFSSKANNTHTKESKVSKNYDELLQAKDETIAVLKETVVDLKESNKQISTTLRGEIDLLKDAFHEMRTLYMHQLEYKKSHIEETDTIEIDSEIANSEEIVWVSIKKFLKQHKVLKEKSQLKIIKRIKKAYKKSDPRIIKSNGKIKLDMSKKYKDILD